jgi:hypothetical protein
MYGDDFEESFSKLREVNTRLSNIIKTNESANDGNHSSQGPTIQRAPTNKRRKGHDRVPVRKVSGQNRNANNRQIRSKISNANPRPRPKRTGKSNRVVPKVKPHGQLPHPVVTTTKQFSANLRSIRGFRKGGQTGIMQKVSFKSQMPGMPFSTTQQGGKHPGCRATGSEFLNVIACNTTLHAAPAQQGTILYQQLLDPVLWGNSRLKILFELYETYYINNLVFELAPVSPSTQSGLVAISCTHEIDMNLTLEDQGEDRVRKIFSMDGAMMSNVYNYMRCHWTEEDYDNWHRENELTDDPVGVIPGTFSLYAMSNFPPADGTSTTLSLFDLIVHYDVSFRDPYMSLDLSTIPLSVDNANWSALGTVASMFYPNPPVSDTQIYLLATALPSQYRDTTIITQILPRTSFTANAITVNANLESSTNAKTLFAGGSVWYARFVSLDAVVGAFVVSPFVGDVIMNKTGCTTWVAGAAPAAVLPVAGVYTLRPFVMDTRN